MSLIEAPAKSGRKVAAGVSVAALVAAAMPIVQQYEGRRLDPYYDIAGILTVCDGETANVEKRRYSPAECDARTVASLTRHANLIVKCYPAATPLVVQVSFLSLAYNIGAQNFCNSTAARRARAGDLAGACAAIPWWNKARNPVTGRLEVSRGLEHRRAAEKALCEKGLG